MSKLYYNLLVVTVGILLLSSTVYCTEQDQRLAQITQVISAVIDSEEIKALAKDGKHDDLNTVLKAVAKKVKKNIKNKLSDTETMNRMILDYIDTMPKDSALRKLVNSGNIKLKVFDSGSTATGSSLGMSYDYSKDIQRFDFEHKEATINSLVFNLSSTGNIAFNSNLNPSDFLDADLSLFWFRSSGGVIPVDSDDEARFINQIEDVLVEVEDRGELRKKYNEIAREMFNKHLSTELYTELSIDAGIESNQSFTTKQYYYGGHAALDVKAWNPNSALAKFNFLDYPFSISRLMIGNDEEWEPRGSALPTVLIGIDQVKPQDQDPRTLAGDSSDYARVRGEIAFKTLVGEIKGQSTYFEANLRHYRELSPSATTKAASLDQYTYFVAALQLPEGMFVSYSTGKLPMDAQKDKVYELGFNYNF